MPSQFLLCAYLAAFDSLSSFDKTRNAQGQRSNQNWGTYYEPDLSQVCWTRYDHYLADKHCGMLAPLLLLDFCNRNKWEDNHDIASTLSTCVTTHVQGTGAHYLVAANYCCYAL